MLWKMQNNNEIQILLFKSLQCNYRHRTQNKDRKEYKLMNDLV